MKIGAWLFGGVWIAGWTTVTLLFDIMLVYGVVQQARSQHWPTTNGRVVSADVKVERDSEEGTSHKPKIRYAYSVNGTKYHCDRIRYGFDASSSKGARRTVHRYRTGSDVTVHFNPRKPSEAVLETTTLAGGDLFGMMFMTPFNMVMIGSWFVAFGAIRGSPDANAPAGNAVKLIDEPGDVRVRLTRITPLGMAAAIAGGTAFALVFIIAFAVGPDSLNAAAAGWAVILATSTVGYVKMRSRISEGWYDLLIDDGGKTLTLPPSLKRSDVGALRFHKITGVEVEKKCGTGDDADSYHPTLHWTDREPQAVPLLSTSDAESAEALAKWLRKRLGVKASGRGANPASPSTADSGLH